jgi:flavin-dependent dehydrogenase
MHMRRRGRSVTIADKVRHPRFHVGESLLPGSLPLLAELGVASDIAAAGFMVKHGACFRTGDGSLRSVFYFDEASAPGPGYAYQVPRAAFDELLLAGARRAGAEVLEETECTKVVSVSAEGAECELRDRNGVTRRIRARSLVDATGQSAWLARQLGLFHKFDDPVRVAMFCHFKGATRDIGRDEGNITIVPLAECWFWVIPLADGITSVGLVLEHAVYRRLGLEPTAVMDRAIARTPCIRELLASAERVVPVHNIADFSYRSTAFAGDGWAMVGDAAYFLDPVFSTGVHVALMQSKRAAAALERGLARGRVLAGDFRSYRVFMNRVMDHYLPLIRSYYDPAFRDLLLQPKNFLGVEDSLVRVLAGKIGGGPVHRLQMRLFEWFVKLHRKGLLPSVKQVPILTVFPEVATA